MPSENEIAAAMNYGQLKENNDKRNFFIYLCRGAFILYAIGILYGITQHEPWRDEAQAWLIVRDTSFSGLLKMLPSEGHPPLWYLLLMPFAKLGMPYMCMNLLNGLIMIAAVYLLLFKTKLPLIVRLVLPFSYFFFFEYSLIARNYGLVVFFCMAIISLYPARFNKPVLYGLCVAGLFNSHVLAFPLAAGLWILYAVEAAQRKLTGRMVLAVAIMFAGSIYLIPYIALNKLNAGFAGQIADHQQHILDAITKGMLIDGNAGLAFLLFAIMTVMIITRIKPLFLLVIGLGGIFYILGYRYSGYLWHAGLVFIVLTTVYGIAESYKPLNAGPKADLLKYGGWVLAATAILQWGNSFCSYKQDIDDAFSGAKDAAGFLLANHLDRQIIVGQQAWAVSAIAPYLGKDIKFYYSECQRYGTYYINDSCFFKEKWALPTDYAVKTAFENFGDKLDKVVLVLNYPVQQETAQALDLIYQTDETPIRKDEGFFIYKFKKQVIHQ